MKLTKKIAFLGLMGLLGAGALFGGGGQARSGGGAVKTIEMWHIQNYDPAPKFIQDAIDRFVADNPDYKVNVTIIANDSYKQKIAVAFASQQLPDIFISWTGGTTNEYIKAGTLADLTPYYNANSAFKNKLLDAGIAQITANGKIYGVPVENVAISGVFYNKEIFARYNLKEPATVRELEAICDTLKANGITPFSLANKTQWTALIFYMQMVTRRGGLGPYAKALDGSGTFEDPAFINAALQLQDWVKKGYFNDGFNGLDEDTGQSRTYLYQGQCAMQIQGTWFVPNIIGENPDFLSKAGFFLYPKDEAGTGDPRTVCGTIGDNFYHVSAKSPYQEKCFELLTRLLDDQSIKDRVAAGRIPPVKNVALDNPVLQVVFSKVQASPDIQFWYDQALIPEVAEVFKQTLQEVMGLTMTPQEMTRRLQQANQAALKK